MDSGVPNASLFVVFAEVEGVSEGDPADDLDRGLASVPDQDVGRRGVVLELLNVLDNEVIGVAGRPDFDVIADVFVVSAVRAFASPGEAEVSSYGELLLGCLVCGSLGASLGSVRLSCRHPTSSSG